MNFTEKANLRYELRPHLAAKHEAYYRAVRAYENAQPWERVYALHHAMCARQDMAEIAWQLKKLEDVTVDTYYIDGYEYGLLERAVARRPTSVRVTFNI